MVPSMFCPSSKCSWEMKQELRKGQGAKILLLFNLDLPGTTLRYAWAAGAVVGVGQYEANVIEVSRLMRATSDRSSSMEDSEQDITIDDTARTFAGIVEGPQGHLVQGSAFTQVLGSPNVPRAQWMDPVFAGQISGHSMVSTNRWRLTLRPADLPLRKFAPKAAIAQVDWPNADPSVFAQYGPLLYGRHDSSQTTKAGAVPLVHVDTATFRYLLCWGRAQGIDAVYVNGTKTAASNYSVVYDTVGGRLCTLVVFNASQGTAAISADARGYETAGDGSGTLITSPTDEIRHFLSQWVFGDYKTGLWLAESSLIDPASFNVTADFFARVSAVSAKRIFGPQRLGLEFLNEWSQAWQTRLFWTNGGKIGCRLEDYGHTALYRDDQTGWIRYDRTPFEASYRPDWESLVSSVNVQHHYSAMAGKYLYAFEVRDPTRTFEAPDSLDLPWSAVSL